MDYGSGVQASNILTREVMITSGWRTPLRRALKWKWEFYDIHIQRIPKMRDQ